MEDEYPTNSHRRKEDRQPREEQPKKKIESVVTGEVIQRKKPLGKRFLETFIGGDARSVSSYVVFDVLIPSAKDVLADVISQGVERTLFGEARSTSRRTGRPGSPFGHVSYNRYAPASPVVRGSVVNDRTPSRRARSLHDFNEIILATRVEAEEVVDRLFDLVSRYESASVSDLYELVNITPSYTDDKWGWVDLRGTTVERIRNGYLLNLPRPEPLD